LQTQHALTNRKERELRHKSSLLRTQRVLLEHNFEAVTERQCQLSTKKADLEALQHQLVGKLAELKRGEVVLTQKERVLAQHKAVLQGEIAEIRGNHCKTESVKSAVVGRIEQAKALLAQLHAEERELGQRQLKLSQTDKELGSLQVLLASEAAEMAPQWEKYETYLQDLELERRSQALHRLRASLSSRESQLREQIRLYSENDLQLQALNSQLQQEQQTLDCFQTDLARKSGKLQGKRDRLEMALQRYEVEKKGLEGWKGRRVEQVPSGCQLNAELQQLKTANFSLQAQIAACTTEGQEKDQATTQLAASLPARQAQLQTRATALQARKSALQAQKRRVMQLETEVAQLAELEGCMNGEVQRLLCKDEDWRRTHAGEMQGVRECMERIRLKEQRVQARQCRSPIRSFRPL